MKWICSRRLSVEFLENVIFSDKSGLRWDVYSSSASSIVSLIRIAKDFVIRYLCCIYFHLYNLVCTRFQFKFGKCKWNMWIEDVNLKTTALIYEVVSIRNKSSKQDLKQVKLEFYFNQPVKPVFYPATATFLSFSQSI